MRVAGIPGSEIQDLLHQIQGIESVEVRQGHTGEIESIEIAITAPAAEKRVIRDVESALMSGLGIHIDHRTITIRRAADGGNSRPETANGGGLAGRDKSLSARFMQPTGTYEERIRLESVLCEQDGELHCDVAVRLELAGELFEGSAREADTRRGRMRASARATSEAIAATLSEGVAIALEGIEEFSICEADGLLALLRIRQGRTRRDFYGAALEEGDAAEAAARAVLDAMNRFLEAGDRNGTLSRKGSD